MKRIITAFLILFAINTSSVYSEDYHSFLKKKADQGDARSQNDLGHMYLDGFPGYNIPKDHEKAVEYLIKAAEQNQVNAMTSVGWFLFTGEYGAPKDYEEAIAWNKKASDLGCSIASYNMGLFYYGGLADLDQDLNEAKRFWLLSASQNIDNNNTCNADADELLIEINQYNKNPSKEMQKLRDFYITLLKSKPI
ncbi:sel1 repeat family protein [Pelagibacterales bacterium SAG-MED29]|nr:sel1 repeat family protein [Pelagibacterales bacterium SAG-MED29]